MERWVFPGQPLAFAAQKDRVRRRAGDWLEEVVQSHESRSWRQSTYQRQRPLDRFLRVSRDDHERRQLRRHPRQIFKQRRLRVPRLVQREAFQVGEVPDRDQEVGKVVGPDGSFEEEFFER